ncbi:MAG: AAA family ATPase [Acidobacteriota bacterium]|nr:AAA family ATPase [Acidobacteriota bacterium]
MRPGIPIGISDFKLLRQGNHYFVDKSGLISQIVRESSQVLLLPRPRRFGKTLNLSMLRYFFARNEPENKSLFEGLAVAEDPEVMEHFGSYPVIYLTLKDAKRADYPQALQHVYDLISQVYVRHLPDLEKGCSSSAEKEQVRDLVEKKADKSTLQDSLALATKLLHRAHGRPPIVLIDEYDAPIHAGYQYGYYEDIVLLIRNLLSGALKDNRHLARGVLTGILRLAKESIFSGLNNLDVYTLLNYDYAEFFGFTQAEVDRLLADYGLQDQGENVRRWYDGYHFGEQNLYNPWSVLQFAKKPREGFKPYWVNTSENALIRSLVIDDKVLTRTELERLLAGDSIEARLSEDVVLRDMDSGAVWGLLTFSGYLNVVERLEGTGVLLDIPNWEILHFYENVVRKWLEKQIGRGPLDQLLSSLIQEDMHSFGKVLSDMVATVLSFHDTAGGEPEKVYHAFVLGLMVHMGNRFEVRSNRESGYGRYDLMVIPREPGRTGFVFEFKKYDAEDDETLEAALASALAQIKERDYAAELRDRRCSRILGVGIAVHGKKVQSGHIDLT